MGNDKPYSLFDFHYNVNARRKLKTLQSLNRLVGRSDNVDKSLVSPHLELLAAVLVLVHRTENGDDLLVGGKRNRSAYSCAASFSSVLSLIFSLTAINDRLLNNF